MCIGCQMPRHIAERLSACREVQPEAVRATAPAPGHAAPGHTAPGHTGPGHATAGHTAPGQAGAACDARGEQRRLHRLLSKMAQLELQPHSFYFI